MSRPEQPEPFLRGCAWPASAEAAYPRCDPGPQGQRLPADTRAAAWIPAGVRFEFETEAREIELHYRCAEAELGYRGEGAGTGFVLFQGDRRIDAASATPGEGRLRLRVGEGSGVRTLYLPEAMRPVVLELAGVDGALRPAPPRPRWLCYGDSIAEGWCASEPAAAWPAVVARRFGFDLVNLGYAGAARGEIASAEELAALPADVITVSHGTNCWTRTPHGVALFAEGLRAFLEIVRSGHPWTPIVALSPLLRPDAEDAPNRLGATLSALRGAFESVVTERRTAGDAKLHLVPGRSLLSAERLPDGIHPDDLGHEAIAMAIGPVLGAALGEGSR